MYADQYYFAALLWRKLKMKFWLSFMKTLIVKILPVPVTLDTPGPPPPTRPSNPFPPMKSIKHRAIRISGQ